MHGTVELQAVQSFHQLGLLRRWLLGWRCLTEVYRAVQSVGQMQIILLLVHATLNTEMSVKLTVQFTVLFARVRKVIVGVHTLEKAVWLGVFVVAATTTKAVFTWNVRDTTRQAPAWRTTRYHTHTHTHTHNVYIQPAAYRRLFGMDANMTPIKIGFSFSSL